MTLRIVRLGSTRHPDEGTRIGTVRRPPRGVPKVEFSARNWYDVWFPTLAPSAPTVKLGLAVKTEQEWTAYVRKYKAEMSRPEASRALDLLATLSQTANFSVGCYCADESRCHRSILRELLLARGARIE
ncbi:MAG: DUF488 family protein [Pseudomonadota bacterium]|nr:DUF488 family protein [Pseudomonadota bacterium]